MAWVADDGSYGGGNHLSFEPNQLTNDQWAKLVEMSDGDRYEYVEAILSGKNEVVAEIEKDNFGEE
jgi:hypothetical protein